MSADGTITINLHHCAPEEAAALAAYLDEECWDWHADARAASLIAGESVFVGGEGVDDAGNPLHPDGCDCEDCLNETEGEWGGQWGADQS